MIKTYNRTQSMIFFALVLALGYWLGATKTWCTIMPAMLALIGGGYFYYRKANLEAPQIKRQGHGLMVAIAALVVTLGLVLFGAGAFNVCWVIPTIMFGIALWMGR